MSGLYTLGGCAGFKCVYPEMHATISCHAGNWRTYLCKVCGRAAWEKKPPIKCKHCGSKYA